MSVDLSGLLYIQKDYLYDLSAIATNEQPVGGYIQDLQSHLGRLYNDFSVASITSQNVVNNQAKINSIVQTEEARLLAKKQEIDSRMDSQNRLIELNDSYRKKQEAYLYIIFVIICSLILVIICLKLRQIIPYPMIAEVFIVLIVFFTCIHVITKLWEIFARDRMNYDNILLSPPIEADKAKIPTDTETDLSFGGLPCTQQTCCAENTTWNPNTLKCDVKCDKDGKLLNDGGICITSCPTGKKPDSINKFCITNTAETFVQKGDTPAPYSPNTNPYSEYKV